MESGVVKGSVKAARLAPGLRYTSFGLKKALLLRSIVGSIPFHVLQQYEYIYVFLNNGKAPRPLLLPLLSLQLV